MLQPKFDFPEKKESLNWRQVSFRILVAAFIGMVLSLVIREFFLFPHSLRGKEMLPTYSAEYRLYFTPIFSEKNLYIGDVVLAEHPKQKGHSFVARILGKPGDRIEIQNKELIRNGVSVLESQIQFEDKRPSLPVTFSHRDNLPEVYLQPGQYFLLCDNRDSCLDSRQIGPVSESQILGKMVF